jgi:hypothetical protein
MLTTFVQLTLPDGRFKTLDYPIDQMDKKVSRAFKHWRLNGRKITEQDIRHRQSVVNTNTGTCMSFTIYFTDNWNMNLRIRSFDEKIPEFQLVFKSYSHEKIEELLTYYGYIYMSD